MGICAEPLPPAPWYPLPGLRQPGPPLGYAPVKLEDSLSGILILAFFCGMLMYIAVDGYKSKGNPVILFLGVSVFILAGFEHCIANMFYFTVAGVWSLKALVYILVMTLGNSAGGMFIPFIRKVGQRT